MKKDIHPPFSKVIARCACGNKFETYSTAKEIIVEICSKCHPLYTGRQRITDTAGRIEKFKRKYGKI